MTPKPPPGFEPVKAPAPTAPPPPPGFAPAEVPSFRNSATAEQGLRHQAVTKPSQIIHDSIKASLGETAADIADYLPPVWVGGTWLDAAQEEKLNPDPRNAGTKMLEEYENLHRGVGQGTNPYVSPDDGRQELGEAFQDAGGAWMFQTPEGRGELINPDSHVVLKDRTGKLKAYSRSKQSDEGGVTGAARLMMPGMLAGPVTGPQRAMALAGENAGQVAAQRSIEAADDVAAFDRMGIQPFSPAFAGTPTKIAAKSLSDMWGVGAPLNTAIENTYGGMANAATRIADNLSPVTTFDQAGASLQRGLDRFRNANSRVLEPGVLRQMGIEPNAPVQAQDMMSAGARARQAEAAPLRVQNDGGTAQTSRGAVVPAAGTRNQTIQARRAIADMDDAEVDTLVRAPAQQTSFATRGEALYESADRQLPRQMRTNGTANPQLMQATNTRNTVNALLQEQERTRIPGGVLGRYAGLADRVRTNLTMDHLRQMRTAVGRDLSNFNYGDVGLDRTQLRALYSSLSRDLEVGYMDLANRAHIQSAVAGNSPARVTPEMARAADRALYQFRRADRYFRQGIDRMDRFMSVVGAEKPEQAAQRLIQASQEGGRGNIGMFRSAMAALRPEERADFAALVVREMGKPLPSARGVAQETGFSPQSFTTRYQKMDPRTRELLFPGDHGRAIDDLFQVSNRMANVEAFANTSNSARSAANVGGIGTAGAMLATGQILPLVGGAGGMYATAYLLSRPQYARWAANYQRMKSIAQQQPQRVNAALITHVNRLAEMARFDPQLQPVVRAISEELGVVEGGDSQRHEDENQPGAQGQKAQDGKADRVPHRGQPNAKSGQFASGGAVSGDDDMGKLPSLRDELTAPSVSTSDPLPSLADGAIKPRRLGLVDHVGNFLGWLGGDTRGSHEYGNRVAAGADLGSAYIPSMMFEGAQDLQEGTENDDPWQRAKGAAYLTAPVLPAIGASTKVAKGVLGATAGGLGGAALYDMVGPDAAAAKDRPRRSNASRLELERGRASNKRDDDMARMESEAKIKREDEAAKVRQAAQLQEEAAEADRNKPFDKQFPTLSKALPFAAFAAPMALGSVIKSGATALKNAGTRNWQTAVGATDSILGGKPKYATEPLVRLEDLKLRNEAYDAGQKKWHAGLDKGTLSAAGAGGFLGAETGMLPMQYNSWNLPAGNPEGDAADAAMTDPAFYGAQLGRFAAGALGGGTGAKMSGALHHPIDPPVSMSKALVNKGLVDDAIPSKAAAAKAKPQSKAIASPDIKQAHKEAKAKKAELVAKKSKATTKDEIARLENMIKEQDSYLRDMEASVMKQMKDFDAFRRNSGG